MRLTSPLKTGHMKNLRSAFLFFGLMLPMVSCTKEDSESPVELHGVLMKTESITTYRYGHYFIDSTAVRSSAVDLEQYVNKRVRITGFYIDSYPPEGGTRIEVPC